ncbi:MAG TPA: DUF4397 domain-containing protein [Gemmatimonadaceae bacterium]|nr:DUF4397 domain-containing protein [Gemmatimonadaceae bacterium]
MNPLMIRYRALALLVGAAALSSCEKNAVQDITGSLPASQIRFFNFGVNAPGVNFYADNTKMTAISSTTGTEATTGVTYGGVGSGGLYAGIEPGQHTFSGRIAATTDKDLAISNVQANLEAGKRYTFYQSGIYNTTTKTVDAFVVEDVFPNEINYGAALVRFVNAISNSNPMTLYGTHTADTTRTLVPIGGPVAYKAGGAFVAIPGGVYDLVTRHTGSTTNVISRAGVSFSPGRVYTITARGDMTASSTSGNRPMLDNTANR